MNYHRLSKPTRFSLYPRPLASTTTVRKDLDGGCVYEEKTVIHELIQGIQMPKKLRANLHSAEAREFLIPKILSSYDNALFVLKSDAFAGQSLAPAFPSASPPHEEPRKQSIKVIKFDQPFSIQQEQNVNSKKRKVSTTWETHEIIPTHQQLSPSNPGEMLSDLQANLSKDTAVLGPETVPSPLSFPSASSEIMDDLQQLQFPDYYDDELWQHHSPPFFSPDSSETNFFAEWGSSSSLDFLDGSDIEHGFEFMNSLF